MAIAGTNDGNVQIGFNLGTGTQAQATWVNVTGNNAILPNRPIMGIALDPSSPAPALPPDMPPSAASTTTLPVLLAMCSA